MNPFDLSLIEHGDNTGRFWDEIRKDKVYALENVVDVGANRGLFSMYMAPFAKQIYAIEAYSGSYMALKHMIEKSGYDFIKPYHLAIGEKNETRKVKLQAVDGGHSVDNFLQAEYEEVEGITLKSFMEREGIDYIDFLKVDIEGSETELFTCPSFKDIASKISIIVGEGHQIENYDRLLEQYGFTILKRDYSFIARRK